MFAMSVRTVDGREEELVFRKEVVRIGRDDRNDMCLPDISVSLAHAEIFPHARGYIVRDLDSSNGTFVNDERIREKELSNGDLLMVGNTVMQFHYRRRLSDTNVQGLIQQTLGEIFVENKRERPDDTSILSRPEIDATQELGRAEWDTADLIRMAYWCNEQQLLGRALELLEQCVGFHAASIMLQGKDGEFRRTVCRSHAENDEPPVADLQAAAHILEQGVCRIEHPSTHSVAQNWLDIQKVGDLTGISFANGKEHQGILYLERGVAEPPFSSSDLSAVMTVAEKLGAAFEIYCETTFDASAKPGREFKALLHELRRTMDFAQSSEMLHEKAISDDNSEMIKSSWEMLRGHQQNLQKLLSALLASID